MKGRTIYTKDPDINIYGSLDEKRNHVYSLSTLINNESDVDELFNWLKKAQGSGKMIFRGVTESFYKNYSHSQRKFKPFLHTSESYELFYELIIDTVVYAKNWNNQTIKKYLFKLGIEDNLFAYLSLMQHFGIPTPLIDFTRNPFVALFFATRKSGDSSYFNNIKEYCSLYFMNGDYQYLNSYRNHFINTVNKNIYDGYSRERAFFYGLRFTPTLLINETDEMFNINNNINIINQEGLFILNGDPNQPLEDQYNHEIEGRKERLLANDKSIENIKDSKLMGCWEIHKSMNGHIRDRLDKEFGISQNYLFPNLHEFKMDFDSSFNYPQRQDVEVNGNYWKNRERAVKYSKLTPGLNAIEGQAITFTRVDKK